MVNDVSKGGDPSNVIKCVKHMNVKVNIVQILCEN